MENNSIDKVPFNLGKWVRQSIELGATKQDLWKHLLYRACFFKRIEDRDAFFELSKEIYPNERFVTDPIENRNGEDEYMVSNIF